ncbi:hypothetical protein ABPG74_000924 [Tetrahymena malaccensis]
MIMYQTDYFEISHNSTKPSRISFQENQCGNNEMESQNQMKGDQQTQGDNQYHYNYYNDSCQTIQEPEYFLDLSNLNPNLVYLCNPTMRYQEVENYSLDKQQQYIQDANYQKCESLGCQQEMQLKENVIKHELKMHNFNSQSSSNDKRYQYQNTFDNIKDQTQNKYNAFGQYFLELENSNISTSGINHGSESQNKPFNQMNLIQGKQINVQNILKNIIQAFLRYFKTMKEDKITTQLSKYQFQNLRKQLVKYMKSHSFNYSVVKYLTTHKFYKLALLNFLQNESMNWLRRSKVVNKHNVEEKILLLKNCIRDPKHFDELIIH